MLLLNTIHIDALEDSTYPVFCAFHIQKPSTLVFQALLIQSLSGYLPDCEISQVYGHIGNQMDRMQATCLPVPVRILLEHHDNRNALLAKRYSQPCPFSIDVAFSDSIDKHTSYVAPIYPQIHDLLATVTCDASTVSFVCETILDVIAPVSHDQDAGYSFVPKDDYDNCSSEDESDIPALIQRYLSD